MPKRTFPKHFDNVNQAWRACVLCGFTTSASEPSDGGTTPASLNGGCMYPESQLIERDGKYYCVEHYGFRFHKKDMDDQDVDAEEPEGAA